MRTTVEYIKNYIKEKYDIDFNLEKEGTHRELYYKNGKKEYNLYCDYAQTNSNEPHTYYWSIFADFMDYKEWYGHGEARMDKGDETIDKIMQEWGFTKIKDKQTTIFDFIGGNSVYTNHNRI